MLDSNWNLLNSQLAFHGLLIKQNVVYDYSSKKKQSLGSFILAKKNQLNKQKTAFQQMWLQMNSILAIQPIAPHNHNKLDNNRISLFLNSIHGLSLMAQSLGLFQKYVKALSRKDILDISQNIILSMPDYYMSLDMLLRKMNKTRYMIKLLRFYRLGKNKIDRSSTKIASIIKIADGVQGPYSNLDLPMKQRKWQWSQVQSDIYGNQSDRKRQYRYRKGHQAYNSGTLGQGNIWVQQRNQPFLWSQRATQDPYPSRSHLSS